MTDNNDTLPSDDWIDDLGKLLLRPDAPSETAGVIIHH